MIEELGRIIVEEMWFQQDGATSNTARETMENVR